MSFLKFLGVTSGFVTPVVTVGYSFWIDAELGVVGFAQANIVIASMMSACFICTEVPSRPAPGAIAVDSRALYDSIAASTLLIH
jgi:hypothetical protein